MSTWKQDKAWSDGLLIQIKSILGVYLIGEASQEEDQQHNTDLVVLKMEAVRVGCRIRRFAYWQNETFRQQFTIRSSRPSGAETELAKIISGWGQYLFYGFADETEAELQAYTILDLNVFRLWLMREMVRNKGTLPGTELQNGDASSTFRIFDWRDIPNDAILAQSLNNHAHKSIHVKEKR